MTLPPHQTIQMADVIVSQELNFIFFRPVRQTIRLVHAGQYSPYNYIAAQIHSSDLVVSVPFVPQTPLIHPSMSVCLCLSPMCDCL